MRLVIAMQYKISLFGSGVSRSAVEVLFRIKLK